MGTKICKDARLESRQMAPELHKAFFVKKKSSKMPFESFRKSEK
jgi:hypothetical protein